MIEKGHGNTRDESKQANEIHRLQWTRFHTIGRRFRGFRVTVFMSGTEKKCILQNLVVRNFVQTRDNLIYGQSVGFLTSLQQKLRLSRVRLCSSASNRLPNEKSRIPNH